MLNILKNVNFVKIVYEKIIFLEDSWIFKLFWVLWNKSFLSCNYLDIKFLGEEA